MNIQLAHALVIRVQAKNLKVVFQEVQSSKHHQSDRTLLVLFKSLATLQGLVLRTWMTS